MTISTITPYFGALYQEDLKTYSAKIGVQKKALTATELKIRYAQLANTSDIVILVSEPGSSINEINKLNFFKGTGGSHVTVTLINSPLVQKELAQKKLTPVEVANKSHSFFVTSYDLHTEDFYETLSAAAQTMQRKGYKDNDLAEAFKKVTYAAK